MARIGAWEGLNAEAEVKVSLPWPELIGEYAANINVVQFDDDGRESHSAAVIVTAQDAREIAAELLRLADAADAKEGGDA